MPFSSHRGRGAVAFKYLNSVVVAARSLPLAPLRVVLEHPHPAAVVDHLDPVDLASVRMHALGAEDLAAAGAAHVADRIGHRVLAALLAAGAVLRRAAAGLGAAIAAITPVLLALRLGRRGQREG